MGSGLVYKCGKPRGESEGDERKIGLMKAEHPKVPVPSVLISFSKKVLLL